jgi:hypothetical protein
MGRLRDYIRQGQVNKLRADAQAEREPLPAGKYRLELVNGVLVETTDADTIELEWKVESGDHAGRRVFQKLKCVGPALAYSVPDLDLLGVTFEALDSLKLPKLLADSNRPGERFRAPVPVGIVVGVVIGHWQGTDGRTRHGIERLVKVLKPAPDLSEFEPEPPAASATAKLEPPAASTTATRDPDEDRCADEDEDDPALEWEDEDNGGGDHDETPF